MRAAMHASLAIAAGIAGGAAEQAAYSVPAFEQPAVVAACAAHLGPHAVSVKVVPPDCEPFLNTVDVTGTATGDPAKVRYSLPTAENFQQMISVDRHDWHARIANNEIFRDGTRGALAGLLCLLGTLSVFEHRRLFPPTPPPKPKSTA